MVWWECKPATYTSFLHTYGSDNQFILSSNIMSKDTLGAKEQQVVQLQGNLNQDQQWLTTEQLQIWDEKRPSMKGKDGCLFTGRDSRTGSTS